MSFKKFKMAAGRHFEKGAVAQIPQRYKNSIRSYFVQDHLNYQKMQKPRLPLSGVPSLCWHPDYKALGGITYHFYPTSNALNYLKFSGNIVEDPTMA